MERNIVNRKTALQIKDTPHSCTGKLNSVYFGPQKAKNKTEILTHSMGCYHAGHSHASGIQSMLLVIVDAKRAKLVKLSTGQWS